MSGYAVYHCEKGNISSGGIGKHIDREEGAKHTYKHADPERRNLNKNYIINKYCNKKLHQGISDRISEGYSAKSKDGNLKKIRHDAVRYTTHILTGSHEQMKELERNPEKFEQWIEANKNFIKNEFGSDNIVRFTLHRDEKTPHIHAVTVNLTQDGRLSAKDIIGNKKQMQSRQDRYADQMKPFGLNRGLRSTGIKHEDAKSYYARIGETLKEGDSIEVYKEKTALQSVFSKEREIDYPKTVDILKNELKNAKIRLNESRSQLIRIEKRESVVLDKVLELHDMEVGLKSKVSATENERLFLRQERLKIAHYINEAKKSEELKETVRNLNEKVKTLNDKINDFKDYEGLTLSRGYIDESVKLRQNLEPKLILNIVEELLERYSYKHYDLFERDFIKELDKRELKYWDGTHEILNNLLEENNIKFDRGYGY